MVWNRGRLRLRGVYCGALRENLVEEREREIRYQ